MIGPPVWDVEAYIHAKSEVETPTRCVEGRVRVVLHEGGDWTVLVHQEEQTFSLILRGDHRSRTNAALAEVFGFLFGRAA